jgi:hypothetical protein
MDSANSIPLEQPDLEAQSHTTSEMTAMSLMCVSNSASSIVGTSVSEDTVVEEHSIEGRDGPDLAASRLEHTQIDGSAAGSE